MKIGNINIGNGLFLAPMAGYTDRAMRLICKKYGAEYMTSEMVSAKAICYGDKKTPLLARITDDELPCAVQIFGSEPEYMREAAVSLCTGLIPTPPSAIDINMGCPVPKVTGNGEGCFLMKDPKKIEKIVYSIKSSVSIPVTVKIRSGWDNAHINAVEAAVAAESGGADAVFVHGRTREQMYSGYADIEVIGRVKSALKIPVAGNGDIKDFPSAKRMFDIGCDGIMIGRGAVGNPFVFSEIIAGIKGLPYTPPDISERVETALLQLSVAIEEKGEYCGVCESRKQLAGYIHGMPSAAKLRGAVNNAKSYDEIKTIFNDFLSECITKSEVQI